MYIKIGTTDIKYLTSQDDYMIFSEVVDSQLSYERPVLVRTSDELDIWFGRSFTDREYFEELLESGVTLFLYKPIKTEQNTKEDNYIDYESFSINLTLYYLESELPTTGESGILYKVISDNGDEIDSNTGLRYDFLIWTDSQYVYVKDLPQNLDQNNTYSLNNREILSINYNGYSGPNYSYPEYQSSFYNNISTQSLDIDEDLLMSHLPDLNKVNSGYETLAYTLTIDENIDWGVNLEESPYIVISGIDEEVLVYFNSGRGVPSSINMRYYTRSIEINVINKPRESIISELLDIFVELSYTASEISDTIYSVYTSFATIPRYFYTLNGFSMNPDFDKTYDILSQLSSNCRRINFISKTIGTDDEPIKVNIEKLTGKDHYRITISRFDYSEVYEGSIFGLGDRLDYQITNNSNLVSCDIIEDYLDSDGNTKYYKLSPEEGERDSTLPTGEWELKRGKEEDYTPEMYMKAMNSIFNDGDTVYFDFFLIPNVENYTSNLDPDYDYYTEYLKFLEYAKLINCQILIQNSDSPWTIQKVTEIPETPEEGIVYEIENEEGGSTFMAIIDGKFQSTTDREIINQYGNDYVFNYTEDGENRLVYFFRPMKVIGNDRPGYYLYLNGLMGDTYSMSTNYILYDNPVKNPYEESDPVEERLQRYKSNYLTDNNQIYYYKKYQNGENFTTSNWMRFVMGKIQRELEKHKWEYLSERMSGNIRTKITSTLYKISDTFSIVRRINLTKFKLIYQENKIELTVETYMSDLINNNISLDITLNYNK